VSKSGMAEVLRRAWEAYRDSRDRLLHGDASVAFYAGWEAAARALSGERRQDEHEHERCEHDLSDARYARCRYCATLFLDAEPVSGEPQEPCACCAGGCQDGCGCNPAVQARCSHEELIGTEDGAECVNCGRAVQPGGETN
jgi:hypothetical protein